MSSFTPENTTPNWGTGTPTTGGKVSALELDQAIGGKVDATNGQSLNQTLVTPTITTAQISQDSTVSGTTTTIGEMATGLSSVPALQDQVTAYGQENNGFSQSISALQQKTSNFTADGGTYLGLFSGTVNGDVSQAQTGNSTYSTVSALATGVQNVITGKAENGNLAGYVLNYSPASNAAYFTYATASGGLAGILLPSSVTVDKKIDGTAANGNLAGLTLNYSPSSLGAYFTYTDSSGATQGIILPGQSITNNKMDKQSGSAPAQLNATSAMSDVATTVNSLISALQAAGLWGRS